jgi:hypothetical protein
VTIKGDDSIGRIESDLGICGAGGPGLKPGVGRVTDTNAPDYDIYFGGLCGQFGQFISQCVA